VNGKQQGNRTLTTIARSIHLVVLIMLFHTCSIPISGAFVAHRQFNKRNPETQSTNDTQEYARNKSSVNEVSVVLSFRASPNAFAPSAPTTLPTDTAQVERSEYEFSKTVPVGDACLVGEVITANAEIALDIWRSSLDRATPHSICNSPPSGGGCAHCNKRDPETPNPNEIKTTYNTNTATTKSA
jgi:hypothetical protein